MIESFAQQLHPHNSTQWEWPPRIPLLALESSHNLVATFLERVGGRRRGHAGCQQGQSTAVAAMAVSGTRRAVTCSRSTLINYHGRAPYSPVTPPIWPTTLSPSDVTGHCIDVLADPLSPELPETRSSREAGPRRSALLAIQGKPPSLTAVPRVVRGPPVTGQTTGAIQVRSSIR